MKTPSLPKLPKFINKATVLSTLAVVFVTTTLAFGIVKYQQQTRLEDAQQAQRDAAASVQARELQTLKLQVSQLQASDKAATDKKQAVCQYMKQLDGDRLITAKVVVPQQCL